MFMGNFFRLIIVVMLTSFYLILSGEAGFYNPTILKLQTSHLQDYSTYQGTTMSDYLSKNLKLRCY